MANIAYLNGEFVNIKDAKISINDRGVQFGDAVYEVWAVKNGKLIDEKGHFERLERSLNEMRIANIYPSHVLKIIFRETMLRNRVKNGIIYLQISRGTAPREHNYPNNLKPNIIVTARAKNFDALNKKATNGLKIKTTKDIRWGRVDIKTTNLLPNIIAKQESIETGFDDVWMIDNDGFITEGSAQNAWIINHDNEIITRPLSNNILPGITRATICKIINNLGAKLIERKFSLEELYTAKEAFVTSATSFVTPIIYVDGKPINNGIAGEMALRLRSEYFNQN